MSRCDWQNFVYEFHEKYGHHIPNHAVTLPSSAIVELRMELLREELKELFEAMEDQDLEKIADNLADLIYVALGTAVSYGVDLDPVFEEVHRSNMTKRAPASPAKPGEKYPEGHDPKGPGYEPPEIARVLLRQVLLSRQRGGG